MHLIRCTPYFLHPTQCPFSENKVRVKVLSYFKLIKLRVNAAVNYLYLKNAAFGGYSIVT